MYKHFGKFVLRSPLLPFSTLSKISNSEISLSDLFNNKLIKESIYIASPELYEELEKLYGGQIDDEESKERLQNSFYRYINRMSTRCTPFGLFAGCSIGTVGDKTHIERNTDLKRYTRLDMFFLCELSRQLSKKLEIRHEVKYYPNTTLYPIGDKYRYIEYEYNENQRIDRISSIEKDEYVDAILHKAKSGAHYINLVEYLIDQGIDEENASSFINELIDAQIIIDNLSPSVTGDDYFKKIISFLSNLRKRHVITPKLLEISKLLKSLDAKNGNNLEVYKTIIDRIEELEIPFNKKLLFQVDTFFNTTHSTIDENIINEIQSAISFLNKINNHVGGNQSLDSFKQAFYKRYEDQEVSLLEALDPELGIGYPINKNSEDISPLIDDIIIPQQNAGNSYNSYINILLRKMIDDSPNKKKEIIFTDDDVAEFPANWEDLPTSIYTLFEVISTESEQNLINLHICAGNSGASLLTRFAHLDTDLENHIGDIISKEQKMAPQSILAEIIHLPQSRVGNILARPHCREYELLYMTNSDLSQDKLIPIYDLLLSVKNGRLVLRSRKLNKEIIPRLTTAHNYNNNTMPIYKFLCDMQMQTGRNNLSFSWGWVETRAFLPRVRYKNIILFPATWVINIKDIQHLFTIKEDGILISEIRNFRKKKDLPTHVMMPDGDNKLFVNWECLLNVRSLFSMIRHRSQIKLTEVFIDDKKAIIKGDNNTFLNECIVAFYKEIKR